MAKIQIRVREQYGKDKGYDRPFLNIVGTAERRTLDALISEQDIIRYY